MGLIIIILFWDKTRFKILGFGLIFLVLGILRYNLSMPVVNESRIEFYNGQKMTFIGVISQEPDVRSNYVKLTVDAQEVATTEDTKYLLRTQKKIKGEVLVNNYLYPEYEYGDKLEVTCELQKPGPVEASAGSAQRDFAYDKYLARYDIYSVCYQPTIKLIAKNQGNFLMAKLLEIKVNFVAVTQKSLSEPQASFLGGLILGAKKAIPDSLMTAFNRTGTTHIVALSGYNITIIAVMVMNLCKALWIPRKKSFWISVLAIVFFILITGAPASAVRAGVMGVLVLLATQLGRLSRVTNTLILAALVMLLINPKVLAFDAGFQLSFLATIGLVFLSPKLEKYFQKLPNYFGLRDNLVATSSAIIMTTPFMMYQFGRFSIVAPLVNVLILPVIPIAMAFGFVLGLAGLLWLPFGQIIGWMAWVILSYIIFIVETFAKFSWASIQIGQLHWVWLLVFYGLIGLSLLGNKLTNKICELRRRDVFRIPARRR